MNAQQTGPEHKSGCASAGTGHYDVIIVGAGLVGASLAVGLRKALPAHCRIAVVDNRDLTQIAATDARTTALSMGSRRILQNLDLWDDLAADAEPIVDIQVSDRGQPGMSRLRARDHRVPALGYVADNGRFGRLLHNRLLHDDGIDCLHPVQVTHIKPIAGSASAGMQIDTSSDTGAGQLTCHLAVLADGGKSPLGAMLGLSFDSRNDGYKALVTNITTSRPHKSTAYERFTDEGPLALLPRRDGRSALVWTMPAALADQRLQLPEPAFLEAIQSRFGYRLGRLIERDACHSWAIEQRSVREQIRPGLVVLGNAAHTLHPVAGQGFNLALRDLEELVHQVSRALDAGQPPGQMDVLLAYQARRQQDQRQIMEASDWLVRTFSSRSGLWLGARTLGLAGMGSLFPLKDWFARRAMGL